MLIEGKKKREGRRRRERRRGSRERKGGRREEKGARNVNLRQAAGVNEARSGVARIIHDYHVTAVCIEFETVSVVHIPRPTIQLYGWSGYVDDAYRFKLNANCCTMHEQPFYIPSLILNFKGGMAQRFGLSLSMDYVYMVYLILTCQTSTRFLLISALEKDALLIMSPQQRCVVNGIIYNQWCMKVHKYKLIAKHKNNLRTTIQFRLK